MAEELVALSTEGGEDEAWQIKMGEGEGKISVYFCLASSFFTASVIQFQAMHETLANLWHPLRGVTIVYLAIRAYKGFLSCQDCAWEKELPFEWDLSTKALPRRAVVAKSCWLHDEGDAPWVVKMRSFSSKGDSVGQDEI
ncbi:hypothetical protein GOBAR_DD23885 [Gossypium barbadense]|nr:hypothetical protein GOBAR_DD23885 [Gossypium barbadense]